MADIEHNETPPVGEEIHLPGPSFLPVACAAGITLMVIGTTINSLISEGAFYGMQTFDQHLVGLIRDGVITLDAAMAASTNPHDLTVELRRLGLVA